MRTKTLLMAACALAAGLISSKAQVTSANIVGYVNQGLAGGYSLINNPLANGTNNAEAVFPAIQPFDALLFWNGGGYTAVNYFGPGNWTDSNGNPIPAPIIPQGFAVFYQNNSGSTESNTFVGTVILTNSITLNPGYSFIGSTAPIGGPADSTNFALPFQPFDAILFWNGNGYTSYNYFGPGSWTDSNGNSVPAPQINVGTGFFYQNNSGSAEQWNQTVIVQ